jgi:hypothetical protein
MKIGPFSFAGGFTAFGRSERACRFFLGGGTVAESPQIQGVIDFIPIVTRIFFGISTHFDRFVFLIILRNGFWGEYGKEAES